MSAVDEKAPKTPAVELRRGGPSDHGSKLRGALVCYVLVAALCSVLAWAAAARLGNRAVLEKNESTILRRTGDLADRLSGLRTVRARRQAIERWASESRGRQAYLVEVTDRRATGGARAIDLVGVAGDTLETGRLSAPEVEDEKRRKAKRLYDWTAEVLHQRAPVIRWRSHPDEEERIGAGVAFHTHEDEESGVTLSRLILVRTRPAARALDWPVASWLLIVLVPGGLAALISWRTGSRRRWAVCSVASIVCWAGTSLWLGVVYEMSRNLTESIGGAALLSRGLEGLLSSGVTVGVAAISLVLTVVVLALAATGVGHRTGRALKQHRVAYLYVLPAAAGMIVLVLIPFAIGLGLGFFNHCEGSYTFVGISNFTEILSGGGAPLTHPLNFYFTLGVTVLWTSVNVFLHLALGLALALLLKDPLLKGKGIYRVLLIIPWAVPNYITALMWKGMFHQQYGAVNLFLELLGIPAVSWFSSFWTAFSANVVTNTWLGFPFMMVVSLGALQSIPQDLYEAAEVDGASRWSAFTQITLPLLRPALLPAVILGSIWTFNMFNIIYLVSGGEPGGSTDILITEAYRWAFIRYERYGLAAAYAILIFFILLGYTYLTNRVSRSAKK